MSPSETIEAIRVLKEIMESLTVSPQLHKVIDSKLMKLIERLN